MCTADRFPFYQIIRAGFMLYLVLPQTQGATNLYIEYVHPTLTKHEQEIEEFIERTHEQAKAVGILYIRRLIDIVREALFGSLPGAKAMAAEEPSTPLPKGPSEYAAALFSRWRVPPLTPYAPQLATDFYSFLSTALQEQQPGATGASASNLIPPNITGKSEKARFIELQKQRLQTVMSALEKESQSIQSQAETSAAGSVDVAANDDRSGVLFKSPSQGNFSNHGGDFDHVSMDEATAAAAHKIGSTGWWGWGGKAVEDGTIKHHVE